LFVRAEGAALNMDQPIAQPVRVLKPETSPNTMRRMMMKVEAV